MTLAPQKGRALIVAGALASVFTALGFRLFDLHVLQHKELAALAQANREQVVHRQGRRGAILDANGNLLANSLSVRIVTADATITAPQASAIAEQLAPLLKTDVDSLTQKLSSQAHYVRLNPRVKLDEDAVQKIRAMKLKGISFEDQFIRSYPNGPLGSHVIGFVNGEHKGVQGIESSMDDYLTGQAGYEVIERDRKGREIRALRDEELGPRDGYNVVLTVDQVVQHIAEQELEKAMAEFKPQAGVIIVSRPKTGEILAMSSRPTFDPTNMEATPADARRNRCISDVAEPGSTFKIVVCSGALNDGIVTLNDQFDCENGAFMYAGRVLHDAHPFGVLSVEEILFHSSNIGAAKVALRMGPARLSDYVHRYGFGHKTEIALPGEVSGIAHPLSRWNNLSITRIPMGHEVAVTPLQMLMALNTIANKGVRMKPMIVKSIKDENGASIFDYQPQVVGQVISPRACMLMTTALRKVVGPEGTAPKAAVEGFDVAGKTGTAQKVENGQYVRKYYSSFIGYFPASDPEISILVSLDDPTGGAFYGGSVAGPVFKAVAEKVAEYLGMEPQPLQPGGFQNLMKLAEIIKTVNPLSVVGTLDQEITGITYDSRRVMPGNLFVAVRGARTDGHRFVNAAIDRGALAIVLEYDGSFNARATRIRVGDARRSMAQASAHFYNHPSQSLKVVGVTGTNGKTTTAFMVRAIMEAAGIPCGLLGTVQYQIGERVIPASRTTPESVEIQEMMSQMLGAGCGGVSMEVSSHALDQQRVSEVDFDVAIFTNLSQDHLDYHGTMEDYFESKIRLFSALGTVQKAGRAVVNADSAYGYELIKRLGGDHAVLSYGVSSAAVIRAEDVRVSAEGSYFVVHTPQGSIPMSLPLIGRYNVSNALAAIGASHALGIDLHTAESALAQLPPVPGRIETIRVPGDFNVFVDYAHTADALRNVLTTVAELTQGRLIVVFGCGGDRDKGKRKPMGQVACELADFTILTTDNPRTEDPREIMKQAEEGFAPDGLGRYQVIEDRREAIECALEIARPGDTVLIAGKGHETYQEFADTVVPFNDRHVVEEYFSLNGTRWKPCV